MIVLRFYFIALVLAVDCNPEIDNCVSCDVNNVCLYCKTEYLLDTSKSLPCTSCSGTDCGSCDGTNRCLSCKEDRFLTEEVVCKTCTNSSCSVCPNDLCRECYDKLKFAYRGDCIDCDN